MKGTQASARNLPWSGVEIKIGTENKYMIIAFAFGEFYTYTGTSDTDESEQKQPKIFTIMFCFYYFNGLNFK